MLFDVVDDEVDADLPLVAGRGAVYVTDPHGWRVSRVGRVSASRGRLTVELHGDGYIYDSEDVTEDEHQYGVPSSAAEARHLAELYEQAEEILAAYRDGSYCPPSPLTVYRDNRPRDRSLFGVMASGWISSMNAYLTGPSLLMDALDPLEPYTRQEEFMNVWRRMRGEVPVPRREKRRGGGGVTIKLAHYD